MPFNSRKNPNWKTNLRLLLVLPFVCQIIAGLGVVGYLSYRNGQRALQEMTIKLRRLVALRIDSYLEQFISGGNNINQINQDYIILNPSLINNLTKLGTYFAYQYQWNQQVNAIAFATEKGDYVKVIKTPLGKLELTIIDQNKSNALLTYEVDKQGKIIKLIRTEPDFSYDPRLESWYQDTLKSEHNYWYQTQKNLETNHSVFINSKKIYDSQGNLLGILSNQTNLIKLNFFLNICVSKHIFINYFSFLSK